MFKSIGTLQYGPGFKISLLVDEGIADFYRSLIPRSVGIQVPRYPPHVSVTRNEQTTTEEPFGRYQGEQIEFEYSNMIVNDELYYWLEVQCPRLTEIRLEFGMNPMPWWDNGYHITVGNVKDF